MIVISKVVGLYFWVMHQAYTKIPERIEMAHFEENRINFTKLITL